MTTANQRLLRMQGCVATVMVVMPEGYAIPKSQERSISKNRQIPPD